MMINEKNEICIYFGARFFFHNNAIDVVKLIKDEQIKILASRKTGVASKIHL